MKFCHFCLALAGFYIFWASSLVEAKVFDSITSPASDCESVFVANLSEFLQITPTLNAAPTRRTELQMTQDGVTLIIEIRAFDPEPATLIARQMRRDQYAMLAEDHVALVFDTQGKSRDGWLFAVNPKGTQLDALIYDGGEIRTDWDAIWHSQAQLETDGWSAQLRIPLSIFGQTQNPNWRFNAERWMPRGNERIRLASLRADQDIYSLGDALSLPVTTSLCARQSLNVKASLRATRTSMPSEDRPDDPLNTRQQLEPGLEIFHESAGGLRTAAALNIDFGEAEVDERQVNLGRFELFQDEKRAFFLHDAGRFSFGGLEGGLVMPYYSRRIGLDARGQPQGLDAGLKLTGQALGVDFGLLAARVDTAVVDTTAGHAGPEHADVAVMRLAKSLNTLHQLGVVGTVGNPEGTSGSHLWGVDYSFRDAAWQGDKTLETQVWVMASSNANGFSGQTETGNAWGASVNYPNLGLTGNAAIQHIGAGFNPALGYLAEDNVLIAEADIGWWQRTQAGDDVIPGMDLYYRRTLDGEERTLEINPELIYETAAGDFFYIETYHQTDELARGYDPLPGLWLAPGDYRWHSLGGGFETSSARRISLIVDAQVGQYYRGHRNNQSFELRWQPNPVWGLGGGLERHQISLPDENQGKLTGTARLANLRLDYTPSTRFSQSLLLQWDNLSDELGISMRARWMWSPTKEFFFALERLRDLNARYRPDPSRASLKFVWNW